MKKGVPLLTPGKKNNFVITVEKYPGMGINEVVPLSGGCVYVYKAGSTFGVTVFSDEDLVTQHATPLFLDSRGSADIYIDPDDFPVTVRVVDDIGKPCVTYDVSQQESL